MRFQSAIVRVPGSNFADGLTTAELGKPVYEKTLLQHDHYCQALEHCGLELIRLEPDVRFPDGTFVEDTAVLTPHSAILTNPGADSRKGEVDIIRPVLSKCFEILYQIQPPGSLEGGDICEADGHYFIGISERTNLEGARQLANILTHQGYSSCFVDIRDTPGILHLKSGIAYLGDNRLALAEAWIRMEVFDGYEIVPVDPQETYAANCVRVNDHILLPEGFPKIKGELEKLGCPVITLEMSEFQKMDGGLSCLSLRF